MPRRAGSSPNPYGFRTFTATREFILLSFRKVALGMGCEPQPLGDNTRKTPFFIFSSFSAQRFISCLTARSRSVDKCLRFHRWLLNGPNADSSAKERGQMFGRTDNFPRELHSLRICCFEAIYIIVSDIS